MEVKDISKAQGHWVLAKMGKKVLRPGGRELTEKLVEHLHITNQDRVIEFAPGLGFTANLSLKKKPKSYIGVDANEQAIELLCKKFHARNGSNSKQNGSALHKNGNALSQNGNDLQFLIGNAEKVDLKEGVATKLYGEAMLTMHADHRKLNIIKEAHRLLEKGGLYAIHEIALTPNTISQELKATIQKDLAQTIRVNARPLTISEWTNLLEEAGFEVINQETNGMFLLKPKRMIEDEGFINTLKIGWNILSSTKARKRVLEMFKVFKKHEQHMQSVVLIARKK